MYKLIEVCLFNLNKKYFQNCSGHNQVSVVILKFLEAYFKKE